MEIDGNWKVRYSVKQQTPFGSEEGDVDEVSTITFKQGNVKGIDPYGYEVSGNYSLTNNIIKAKVVATPYDTDAESIFEGLNGKFTLELEGEFNSPNYFSMQGKVVENPTYEIVLNCSRNPAQD